MGFATVVANALCAFLVLFSVPAWAEPSQSFAPPQILKVLTLNFNDETVFEDKNYRFRDRRIEAITHWIEQNDPDIVLIQEGWNYRGYPSVVIPLAERLGYDFAYRIGMGAPLLMYDSNGILAKKKFHLGQERDVRLPHSAPWLGDGKNWVVVFGKVSWAVGARLTLADGSPLYVYTSHLIGSSQRDRDDQLLAIERSLRKHVARNGEDWKQVHSLIAGDFNSGPETTGVQELGRLGYEDSFASVHPGLSACTNCADPDSFDFNPMTIAAGQFPAQDKLTGNERIDYIFTHGPETRALASTLTFSKPLNGVWMSDHFGVMSTIQVSGAMQDAPEVPNPVRDSVSSTARSQVIRITDAVFNSPERQDAWVVDSALGATFINETDHPIRIRVRPVVPGEGRVWAKQSVGLSPGRAAAFFFDPGFQYEFGARGNRGEGLFGGFLVP